MTAVRPSFRARTAAEYAPAWPQVRFSDAGGGRQAATASPGRLELTTPEAVADLRRSLGRTLAESRRSVRVTQDRLAVLVRWSRSSIANVEVGRQTAQRTFWMACDVALGCEGALLAAWGRTDALARRLREQQKEAQIRQLLTASPPGYVCRELYRLLADSGWPP
ncbi:helix-turn-helix transcriptional regulator [Micromonospora rifamycinica]|uniref:helix-turn-helix domain-containing protein n=1 Tax=Micromonospora rifamycinica TaxID=291594 RepID=UPI00342EFB0C